MEQRQLLNFLMVCEEKNFSRAAERRFISQQGLSKSILELEAEIGAPLFDRSHRGARLTEYGRVLESAARAYTNQHDYILETLASMKAKSNVSLSVGIATNCPLPPRFLGDFIRKHPEIFLSVKTFPPDTCQQHILEQRLQLGISFPPVDTELFNAVLLEKTNVFLVMGKNHPLADRKSVKMSELRNENIIVPSFFYQHTSKILDLCRRNGIVADTQIASLDYGLIVELCSTGRYIGFGSRGMESLKELVAVGIEGEEITMELYLIMNRRSFINRAAETFVAWAKETAWPAPFA
jgi:DNA-binding transcriptional LysR family regulator